MLHPRGGLHYTEPNRIVVRQKDGIPPIVKLLSSANPEIQALAAHAIANLSLHGTYPSISSSPCCRSIHVLFPFGSSED
jgi:hypothetical protein